MSQQTSTSIFVVSGRYFDVIRPDPADVLAWDIAWSLSGQNRFVHHTMVPWDVVSHTGLVYMLAMQDLKGAISNADKLGLLLHDAPEAYIGDMSRPLKSVMPKFQEIEHAILVAILTRFGLRHDQIDWDLVKRYDNQALWIERQVLLPMFDGLKTDAIYTSCKQYDMPKLPTLAKAKPDQYIGLLRECAINVNAPDLKSLFHQPDYIFQSLSAKATAETGPRPRQGGPEPLAHDFTRMDVVDVPEEKASLTMAEVRALSKQGKEVDDFNPHGTGPVASDNLYGVKV
jgi:hypothetical protein